MQPVSVNKLSLIFFFWTIKEKLKNREMNTSQEMGCGEMLMDVGKSTVQLSHVTNCITIYKRREDTLLQTKNDERLVCYIPYEAKFLLLH